MARKALRYVLSFALLALALSVAAAAQEPAPQPQVKIDWQRGPTVGNLGNIAQIKVPAGYAFAGKQGAQAVLQLTQNIPNGEEVGVLVSQSEGSSWFMMFRYEETGYVKDDDKDKLDADTMLTNIKNGTEEANKQRRAKGWPGFHVMGWEHTPYYDPLTHNLTWAIKGKGDDANDTGSINHSIRLLGRKGVIKVNLVADPAQYAATVGEFNTLISGFSYNQGSRYSDFTKGDKVAEYGLAALIAGGAGAVLLKTGLLAKFWKLIVVGIAALVGFIKKLFGSIFGSKETKIEDPNSQAAAGGQ
jgi:uncharacterized membrane-anchored protein